MPTLSPSIADARDAEQAVGSLAALEQRMPRRGCPTVAELSARLYSAYQVEDGSVRLAGCTLEQIPIVRVTATAQEREVALFLTPTGEKLEDATITELGLQDLVRCDRPPRLTAKEQTDLEEVGRRGIEEYCRRNATRLAPETVKLEIAWCRWAAGKLRFSIGGNVAELPFADWGVRLAPPAFVCPHTETSTYRLSRLDDGRIVAAEEVGTCEATGQRMLRDELVTCSVSGKQVSAELAEQCEVTGHPVLRELMVSCPRCFSTVSPQAVRGDRCEGCTTPTAVSKDDPRLRVVLGEYPGLERWRRWRLAETPRSYVLEGRGIIHFKTLLVVLGKQSLEVLRIADRRRFSRDWIDRPREGWSKLLAQA